MIIYTYERFSTQNNESHVLYFTILIVKSFKRIEFEHSTFIRFYLQNSNHKQFLTIKILILNFQQ